MTLSRRVILLTFGLFALFGCAMFLLQRHYQRRVAQAEARYFLNEMYGTLVYRSLRGQMFVGRPDVAREMYGEIREVLKTQQKPSKQHSWHALWDPKQVEPLQIGELLVIRRNGVEAFVDDLTIEEVNERTGENFPVMWSEVTPRRFNSKALKKAVDTGKDANETVQTAQGPELRFYKPLPNVKRCQGCHGADHEIRGVVYLRVPLNPLETKIRLDAIRTAIFLASGAAVTALLLMLFLKRWLLIPLQQLGTVAEKVSKGDFSEEPPLFGSDELARLSLQMGQMVKALRRMIEPGDNRPTRQSPPAEVCLMVHLPDSGDVAPLFSRAGALVWTHLATGDYWVAFGGAGAWPKVLFTALELYQAGGRVLIQDPEAPALLTTPLETGVTIHSQRIKAREIQEAGFQLDQIADGAWRLRGILPGSRADAMDPELFEV